MQECESYTEVVHLKNVSIQTVADDYLFNNLPFIVTDASQEWKAFSDLDVNSLKKVCSLNTYVLVPLSTGLNFIVLLTGIANFHANYSRKNLLLSISVVHR